MVVGRTTKAQPGRRLVSSLLPTWNDETAFEHRGVDPVIEWPRDPIDTTTWLIALHVEVERRGGAADRQAAPARTQILGSSAASRSGQPPSL
jgi:hypothetical protein